jgi:hypothetical protein
MSPTPYGSCNTFHTLCPVLDRRDLCKFICLFIVMTTVLNFVSMATEFS